MLKDKLKKAREDLHKKDVRCNKLKAALDSQDMQELEGSRFPSNNSLNSRHT